MLISISYNYCKRDADDVKKLITKLTRSYVFRVNTALREEDGQMDSVSCGHTLGTIGIQRFYPD